MSGNNSSDLLLNIEIEMKKLYQEFSISQPLQNSSDQFLEKIRFCINFLIEEKKTLETSRPNSILKLESYQIDDILQAKNKLKSTQNELLRYEKSLIEKAQILQQKESEFKYIIQAINQDKANIDLEQSKLSESLKIYEKNCKEFEEKTTKFNHEYQSFISEKKLLENERENISLVKMQVNNNFNKSEKISKVNTIMQEKLEKEIRKYQELNKSLNDLQEDLTTRERMIQSTKEEVDRSINALESERNYLKQEKEEILELKKQIDQETLNLHSRLGELEKKSNSNSEKGFKSYSKPVDSQETSEIESLFVNLDSQLVVFNQELSIKESKLLGLAQKNSEDQAKLAKSFSKIQEINKSLNESKAEITIFYSETLPLIEFLYNKVQSLLEELKENLKKVNILQTRITQDVYLRTLITDNEATPKNIPETIFFNYSAPGTSSGTPKHFEEAKKDDLGHQDQYFLSDSKAVDDMLKELTFKIKNVEEKEKKLNSKTKNLVKASEIIEKAKMQIVMDKEEVSKEKERNKMLKYQLETAISEIANKEKELKAFKQELERQASLLKIKENQIEIRLMQVRSE